MIKYGVDKVDIFQTNDLAEKRDMGSVTNTMFALGRAVSSITEYCFKDMEAQTAINTVIKFYFIYRH